MKQPKNDLYKKLAMAALYDFKRTEGKHADELLCELSPNVSDEIKDNKFNPSLLHKSILSKLIEIIKSEEFNKSLLSYCVRECKYLSNTKAVKMTALEKRLATDANPYLENGTAYFDKPVSRKEMTKLIKAAQALAVGKYWQDRELDCYVAFTPDGKREWFDYDSDYPKDIAKCKAAAKLWAKGDTDASYAVQD